MSTYVPLSSAGIKNKKQTKKTLKTKQTNISIAVTLKQKIKLLPVTDHTWSRHHTVCNP